MVIPESVEPSMESKGYFGDSMSTMTSVWTHSKFIITELARDPYAERFKSPMKRLLTFRVLWCFFATACELAVSFPLAMLMTALHDVSEDAFYEMAKLFAMTACIAAPVLAASHYFGEMVYIRLRESSTLILLHRYHSNHNYYHISSYDNVDNPGQRMDKDVDNWAWGLSQFGTLVLRNTLRLFGWCGILLWIGAEMIFYCFFAAAIAVALGIIVFASKLAAIQFSIAKHRADFRAAVIRTRDNGETIAFYGAAPFESFWNGQRLGLLVNDLLLKAKWCAGLEFCEKIFKYAATITPLLLLFPAFKRGEIEFGTMMQAAFACRELLMALTLVISKLEQLSQIQAGGHRVVDLILAMNEIDSTITHPPVIDGAEVGSARSVRSARIDQESLDIDDAPADEPPAPSNRQNDFLSPEDAGSGRRLSMQSVRYRGIKCRFFAVRGNPTPGESRPRSRSRSRSIQRVDGAGGELESKEDHDHPQEEWVLITNNLSIIVPNTHSLLLYKLNIEIAQFQNVLVVGPSGAGKSSLLRVLCGLWRWGHGQITRLHDDDVMFLPQKPYLPTFSDDENTLRNQLLFPKLYLNQEEQNGDQLTARQFYRTLDLVNLEYILDYEDMEDKESRDWGKLLSLGEQQRLSIGRVLVAKPTMVFLDEATSALDVDNQARKYKLLQDENITFMSVGHRANLVEFHESVLQIVGDGSWKMWTREEYLMRQHL